MQNVYFKGLEKALNDGCYIKVFSCSLRYPVVRVEKKSSETNKEKLVSYAESGNVLAALNRASSKIIDELSGKNDNSKVLCNRTLIDNVVEQGYTLHFFKLADNKVLSMICAGYENYIPVKTVIGNDVKGSFQMLDATLETFNFDRPFDFQNFADSQTAPVYEYHKNLTKKRTAK